MTSSRYNPKKPAACRDHVTIVMLTYNRCAELMRSLAHLLTLPEQPRIIVVDNAGTDGTAERVSACVPQIQIVRSAVNLGAAGRNLGVDTVVTPYVAFCDDDTWWAPGALDAAAQILDLHPSIAVLNAHIVVGPDAIPDPACLHMAQSPLKTVPGVGPMLIGFMAGAIVMRTSAFRNAGGYWPPFFIGGEETLLAMDILDAGGHIVYAPALQVHHWPSSLRDSAQRKRLLARNALWTAWMRLPGKMALARTWQTLQTLPCAGARRSAVIDALAGVGPVFRHRRVLGGATRDLLDHVWRHEAARARDLP